MNADSSAAHIGGDVGRLAPIDGPDSDRPLARRGRRSIEKRRLILDVATAVFIQNGYLGTSMDEVSARAGVSKQTVYRHFSDKAALFNEIIERAGRKVSERLLEALEGLEEIDDPEPALRELARRLLVAIHEPSVLHMRRLIIGEAGRFPELGQRWYEHGFQRGISSLATVLQGFADRGWLRLDDPERAAAHLAGLILWVPINRAMFTGVDDIPDAEAERMSSDAIRVFVAAYGRRSLQGNEPLEA